MTGTQSHGSMMLALSLVASLAAASALAEEEKPSLRGHVPAEFSSGAVAHPDTTGSTLDEPDDSLACQRVRRKLWVEGEGWIVRRVNICR